MRKLWLFIIAAGLTGCTVVARHRLDDQFGTAEVRNRQTASGEASNYFSQVRPLLERRCVVCHACYDAPCQLNLASHGGIDRGASTERVYADRLLATQPTRIHIDSPDAAGWRSMGFFPVLNEREQTAEANLQGSVLYQMLELKRLNPLPADPIAPDSFDFNLNRDEQCPRIEQMEQFREKFPLWGMPYGLPGLNETERAIIRGWLAGGAKTPSPPALPAAMEKQVKDWEQFLNAESPKTQLMSRYVYEHLFLAHIHFDKLPPGEFFRLVRSKTPPGEPVEEIPSRRPYDHPGAEKFYYRLRRDPSSSVAKTHMPYALNPNRMARWKELFLEPDFEIGALPGYETEVAANPFIAFQALPVRSRYSFMLDEARTTIEAFIKGPVCRGNQALNVIEDRFWVMFINPDAPIVAAEDEFLKKNAELLSLPSEESSNALAIENWIEYSRLQDKFLSEKSIFLADLFPDQKAPSLDLLWDGNKTNRNAALTIFRHHNSATVIRGFVGDTPKTAWLIGYALLERIHYLLVAGFDVFGNVGHQFNARKYMDFLRMEGEFNFLSLLPPDVREKERDFWYRDAEEQVVEYISWNKGRDSRKTFSDSGIPYQTGNPKREVLQMLSQKLGPALEMQFSLNGVPKKLKLQLERLMQAPGRSVHLMPQVAVLRIKSGRRYEIFSLILENGYTNVTAIFREDSRMRPDEDRLIVARGLVGAYPNAFYDVDQTQLPDFVAAVEQLENEQDYRVLMDKFGTRRTSSAFWEFSDWLHEYSRQSSAVEGGILDYNRFENR